MGLVSCAMSLTQMRDSGMSVGIVTAQGGIWYL